MHFTLDIAVWKNRTILFKCKIWYLQ